jgi:predicted methyltransferase
MVAMARPQALRQYDQIWMRAPALIRQTLLIAPYLAGKRIVFLGDGDCMSLMLGIFGTYSLIVPPEHMTVLDFDKRLIKQIQAFSRENRFPTIISTFPYNVLDPIPVELVGMADWFYVNPPYGFSNQGLSTIVWLSRCVTLCKQRCSGCLILPYDSNRGEAQIAMYNIQKYLVELGFVVCDMAQQMHQYYLDDDPPLASSVLIVNRDFPHARERYRYSHKISFEEAKDFYGKSVLPPYPHYINENGEPDFVWEESCINNQLTRSK